MGCLIACKILVDQDRSMLFLLIYIVYMRVEKTDAEIEVQQGNGKVNL